jgi:hypothetical protein
MGCGRDRLILNRNLVLGQHPPNRIHEVKRILLRPKVHINCMQPVHVFVLISRIERRKMPFLRVSWGAAVSLAVLGIHSQRDKSGFFVGVLNVGAIQICCAHVSFSIEWFLRYTNVRRKHLDLESPRCLQSLCALSSATHSRIGKHRSLCQIDDEVV